MLTSAKQHLINKLLRLTAALSPEKLQKFRTSFYADAKNILAQNACTRVDPLEVCLSRKHIEETQHVFTHKVSKILHPLVFISLFQ